MIVSTIFRSRSRFSSRATNLLPQRLRRIAAGGLVYSRVCFAVFYFVPSSMFYDLNCNMYTVVELELCQVPYRLSVRLDSEDVLTNTVCNEP